LRNHSVAIKLLHPHLANEPHIAERFLFEAKTLQELSHDHIVRFYRFEQSGDRSFLVMEYVPGTTLEERLPISNLAELKRITIDICGALSYAHKLGVIHRDVKPGRRKPAMVFVAASVALLLITCVVGGFFVWNMAPSLPFLSRFGRNSSQDELLAEKSESETAGLSVSDMSLQAIPLESSPTPDEDIPSANSPTAAPTEEIKPTEVPSQIEIQQPTEVPPEATATPLPWYLDPNRSIEILWDTAHGPRQTSSSPGDIYTPTSLFSKVTGDLQQQSMDVVEGGLIELPGSYDVVVVAAESVAKENITDGEIDLILVSCKKAGEW
jgi:serine/threonine protein kinase